MSVRICNVEKKIMGEGENINKKIINLPITDRIVWVATSDSLYYSILKTSI